MTPPDLPLHLLLACDADHAPPVHVGPGCIRRDLPGAGTARAWIAEMAPGSQWPCVDHHDAPELVYVLEGEVIEGGQSHGAGTYLLFPKGSSHQPRTVSGARMFGVNL